VTLAHHGFGNTGERKDLSQIGTMHVRTFLCEPSPNNWAAEISHLANVHAVVIRSRELHNTDTHNFHANGGREMWLTKDDAVQMYARFWIARHGSAASRLARETAASLQVNGDHEGHVIWNQVADNIDRRLSSKMSRPEPVLQQALSDF